MNVRILVHVRYRSHIIQSMCDATQVPQAKDTTFFCATKTYSTPKQRMFHLKRFSICSRRYIPRIQGERYIFFPLACISSTTMQRSRPPYGVRLTRHQDHTLGEVPFKARPLTTDREVVQRSVSWVGCAAGRALLCCGKRVGPLVAVQKRIQRHRQAFGGVCLIDTVPFDSRLVF